MVVVILQIKQKTLDRDADVWSENSQICSKYVFTLVLTCSSPHASPPPPPYTHSVIIWHVIIPHTHTDCYNLTCNNLPPPDSHTVLEVKQLLVAPFFSSSSSKHHQLCFSSSTFISSLLLFILLLILHAALNTNRPLEEFLTQAASDQSFIRLVILLLCS